MTLSTLAYALLTATLALCTLGAVVPALIGGVL